jgi:cytochrome c biogenesis protein
VQDEAAVDAPGGSDRSRARAGPVVRTVVEVGGLARTDQAGYGEEFATLAVLPGPRQ